MPDEFPTLEVVTLIGLLVVLVRVRELFVGLGEIPKVADALGRALGAADFAGARRVAEAARGATLSTLGVAVVDAAASARVETPSEARRAVERAFGRAARRIRRGHARDLAATAVLLGAGAYATRASLDVGPAFYALLLAALLATLTGALLRRTLRARLAGVREALMRAALDASGKAQASAPTDAPRPA